MLGWSRAWKEEDWKTGNKEGCERDILVDLGEGAQSLGIFCSCPRQGKQEIIRRTHPVDIGHSLTSAR